MQTGKVISTLGRLVLHSLRSASQPRLSETEPKWFMFETSCYAFGGLIHRFAKLNVNKVNFFYGIVFILDEVVPFDIHFQYIGNTFICIA